MEKFNKELRETFGGKIENVNILSQRVDEYKEETNKQMGSGFKNLDETLDRTSESIKVSPNTEESRKEIEIREYQGVILSENKNNHNLSLIHI